MAIGAWILIGWIVMSLPAGLIIGHAMALALHGSSQKRRVDE